MQSIADDTLYPNPRIRTVEVYARGKEDSRSAMLGISMAWEGLFFADDENEDDVKSELAELNSFLAEMSEISAYLISNTEAPEEAEFDYNEFYERIEKRLEAYGVYRDIAGEDDRETEREREKDRGQMDLGLWESRIVQRWAKNNQIKLELLSSKAFCSLVTYRQIRVRKDSGCMQKLASRKEYAGKNTVR